MKGGVRGVRGRQKSLKKGVIWPKNRRKSRARGSYNPPNIPKIIYIIYIILYIIYYILYIMYHILFSFYKWFFDFLEVNFWPIFELLMSPTPPEHLISYCFRLWSWFLIIWEGLAQFLDFWKVSRFQKGQIFRLLSLDFTVFILASALISIAVNCVNIQEVYCVCSIKFCQRWCWLALICSDKVSFVSQKYETDLTNSGIHYFMIKTPNEVTFDPSQLEYIK